MTPQEVGWVAGLLEGEGSFHVRPLKGRHYGTIRVGSTDEDVIHQLHLVTGVGNLGGPFLYASQTLAKKPHYTWTVTRNSEIRMICEAILTLMGERRREQIEYMLSKMQTTHYNKERSSV